MSPQTQTGYVVVFVLRGALERGLRRVGDENRDLMNFRSGSDKKRNPQQNTKMRRAYTQKDIKRNVPCGLRGPRPGLGRILTVPEARCLTVTGDLRTTEIFGVHSAAEIETYSLCDNRPPKNTLFYTILRWFFFEQRLWW